MESLSAHVSNCTPRLEASYWCPSCDQAEYLGVEQFRDGSFATNHSNKGSTMKRASDFLKHSRCSDCFKRLNRRPVDIMDGPAELEIGSNHDIELSHGRYMAMKTPRYPESSGNIGYYELESSCGLESGDRSSTVSKLVRNVRCPDENGWDSKSPTRQEVEDSNLNHLGASDPGTVIERAKTSSHGNVNSQRKSRTGLRLSTPDRPLENSPPVDSHEQIGASNSSTSQITPGTAIAGSLYHPPREVSLI